jgi:hypothetical protein
MVHLLKMHICDCLFKTSELRDTECSYVYYVVT